jgi:ElaB/YqjD/DUF883 family membrane-anchored ribosome-binding protein
MKTFPSLLSALLIVLLLSSGLSGCSTTQIAYNYADWLLIHRINSYFGVTKTQNNFIKQRLTEHFAWHRKNELPLYAHFLVMLKAKAEDGLTEEEVDWAFNSVDARLDELLTQLIPDMASFLSSLHPEQINYFEKKVSKPSQTRERSPEEIKKDLEERAEELIDDMEEWFGNLSKTQEEQIKKLSFNLPDTKKDWAAYRHMRRQALIQFLRQTPSSSEIEALLNSWIRQSPDEYQQKFERIVRATKTMILQIDPLLSPKQRQHALKQLDDYIEDFKALSHR